MLSCPPAITISDSPLQDLLRRQGDRAQAGAAHLVDAERGLGIRDAGGAGGLAGRILPLRGGQHLAEDRLVNLLGRELGALDRGFQRRGAEHMGRGRSERHR